VKKYKLPRQIRAGTNKEICWRKLRRQKFTHPKEIQNTPNICGHHLNVVFLQLSFVILIDEQVESIFDRQIEKPKCDYWTFIVI
jgi:hypothetical protein